MNNFNPFEMGLNGDDCVPPEDYNPDEDIPQKDPKIIKNLSKNPKYLQIKPISLKNCIEKSGQIESGDSIKSSFKKKEDGNILTFGKYKGQTKNWVKKNDVGYFTWAKENIKGF